MWLYNAFVAVGISCGKVVLTSEHFVVVLRNDVVERFQFKRSSCFALSCILIRNLKLCLENMSTYADDVPAGTIPDLDTCIREAHECACEVGCLYYSD
jgi:hypothetical protein